MSKEQLAILRAIGRILRERNIPITTQAVPEVWEELVGILEHQVVPTRPTAFAASASAVTMKPVMPSSITPRVVASPAATFY
jgi:hypothetical protein